MFETAINYLVGFVLIVPFVALVVMAYFRIGDGLGNKGERVC